MYQRELTLRSYIIKIPVFVEITEVDLTLSRLLYGAHVGAGRVFCIKTCLRDCHQIGHSGHNDRQAENEETPFGASGYEAIEKEEAEDHHFAIIDEFCAVGNLNACDGATQGGESQQRLKPPRLLPETEIIEEDGDC